VTSTTPAAAPGWYPDSAPGRLRWFDGAAWTDHVTSAQQAVPTARSIGNTPAQTVEERQHASLTPTTLLPGRTGLPGETSPRAGLPVALRARGIGCSWWSVAAVFVGVLTLVVWPLALLSGLIGLAAILRERRQGTNRVGFGGFAIAVALVARLGMRAFDVWTPVLLLV
jgi:hypothetical protein